MEVASFLKIDEVVLLGDYADFYSVSRHLKNPRLPKLLEEEVRSVISGLEELDEAFPKAKKIYLEGNHEARLEAYLSNHAPALFGLSSCPELFQISTKPSWCYKRFDRNQAHRVLGSDLFARHRPLAMTPKSAIQRALVSCCYGDIHKIEECQLVGLDGKLKIAFCPGWLGDVRLKAFDYMLSPPQWQMGFALVSFDPSKKMFHHEIIHIKNNFTCLARGKLFKT